MVCCVACVCCDWLAVTTLVLVLQHSNENQSFLNNNNNKISIQVQVHCKNVNFYYYMAVSQKGWKRSNSRARLAKIDIDGGLDFLI